MASRLERDYLRSPWPAMCSPARDRCLPYVVVHLELIAAGLPPAV